MSSATNDERFTYREYPADTKLNSFLDAIDAHGHGANGGADLDVDTVSHDQVSILRPSAQTVADATVYVGGGTYLKTDGSGSVTVVAQDSPSFSVVPAASGSRIDLLTIGNTGVLSITEGSPSGVPSAPAYPSDLLPIAEVTISETSDVQIATADIKDVRPVMCLGAGGGGTTTTGTSSEYKKAFTTSTSEVVSHSLGDYPIVSVIDGSNQVLIPEDIVHNSTNQLTVTFNEAETGTILCIAGGTATDHGGLTGLSDDDHPQYMLLNGSRAMGADFVADSTNARDLGTSSVYWKDMYMQGTLYLGVTTLTATKVSNLDTLTTGSTSDGKALHYHAYGYTGSCSGIAEDATNTFTHSLGYIPSVTIIDTTTEATRKTWYITAISDTQVTIKNPGGAGASATVYCF